MTTLFIISLCLNVILAIGVITLRRDIKRERRLAGEYIGKFQRAWTGLNGIAFIARAMRRDEIARGEAAKEIDRIRIEALR